MRKPSTPKQSHLLQLGAACLFATTTGVWCHMTTLLVSSHGVQSGLTQVTLASEATKPSEASEPPQSPRSVANPSETREEQCESQLCPDSPDNFWGLTRAEMIPDELEVSRFYKALWAVAVEMKRLEVGHFQRLTRWLQSPSKVAIHLSPFETALVNFERYAAIISIAGAKMNQPDSLPSLIADFPGFRAEELPALMEFFSYTQRMKLPLQAKDIQELIVNYGREGATQKIRTLVNQTLTLRKQAFNDPRLAHLNQGFEATTVAAKLRTIDFRAQSNRLSTTDLNNLVSFYFVARFVNDLLNDPALLKALTTREFRAEDYLGLFLKDERRHWLNADGSLTNEAESDVGRNFELTGSCGFLLRSVFSWAPTQEQVDRFEKGLSVRKEKLLAVLRTKISPPSFQRLKEKSSNWDVILPLSREGQLRLLEREMQEILKDTREGTSADSFTENPLETAFSLAHFTWRNRIAVGIDRLCRLHAGNRPKDLSSENRILISPWTVRFSDQTASADHELMHLVLKDLKDERLDDATQNWISTTKACLRANHPETPNEKMIEEDFADLVAFSLEGKTKSYICSVTAIQRWEPVIDNPFGIRIYRNRSERALTSQPLDYSYSSPLFRMLHSHLVRKGEVPSVCRELVRRERVEMKIKNCLEPR